MEEGEGVDGDGAEVVLRAGLELEFDGGDTPLGIDDEFAARERRVEEALSGGGPQQVRLHLLVGAVVEPQSRAQVATLDHDGITTFSLKTTNTWRRRRHASPLL